MGSHSNLFLKQGVSCLASAPTLQFSPMTSPFRFDLLCWFSPCTPHCPPRTLHHHSKHSPKCTFPPRFGLLIPLSRRLLKPNAILSPRMMRPSRTNFFPLGFVSVVFHTDVSEDVQAALFTVKHPRSSGIWPPFLMILCFYTVLWTGETCCISWWHHDWRKDYCLLWCVLFYRGLFLLLYHCMQCFINSEGTDSM